MNLPQSLATLSLIILPTLSWGTFYNYHPQSVLTLGQGLSPNALQETKAPCISFQSRPVDAGALTTEFSSSLVSNSEELKNSLSVDTHIDASYLMYQGGATFTYNTESLFSRDRLTFVVTARTEFPRLQISEYSLLPQYQALIDANRHADFERICGSEIVTMERRGAQVSVIITIEGLTETEKRRITAHVEGSGGFGPVRGSARADLQTLMESARRSNRISAQVVASGGNGFSDLANIIMGFTTEAGAFSRIETELAAFLRNFNASNAAPMGFETTSMGMFGWNPAHEDLWGELRYQRLSAITSRYRQFMARLQQIRRLSDHRDVRYRLMNSEQLAALETAIPQLESDVETLAANHRLCQQDFSSSCAMPALNRSQYDDLPVPSDRAYITWSTVIEVLPSREGGLITITAEGVPLRSLSLRAGAEELARADFDPATSIAELRLAREAIAELAISGPRSWTVVAEDIFGQHFARISQCGMHPFSEITRSAYVFHCRADDGRDSAWVPVLR